jgi:hypothetical protein
VQKLSNGAARDPRAAALALDRFLASAKRPAIFEPGEDPLPMAEDCFSVTERNGRIILECWDQRRTFSRRIVGMASEQPGSLDLEVERFGGKVYTLTVADQNHPESNYVRQRGIRHKHREELHHALRRQYPDWRIEELSSDPDLHHTLSSIYPRALLRKGTSALAAISAPPEAVAPEAALSFGLIWLDYLRERESRLNVQGLVLLAPAGREAELCHRVRHLDPARATYTVMVYERDFEQVVDPADYTNLTTRLKPALSASIGANAPNFIFGRENLEAVLESRVREEIEQIDASLLKSPVYSQVLQFAGASRGLMDLVAVDRAGRLAVIELKVDQEIQLPMQALDYWIRVRWHLQHGDFAKSGYYPGQVLSQEPPLLYLVAPAVEFHPSNETVLKYLAPQITVERVGVGLEWKRELKVVLRSPGLPRL